MTYSEQDLELIRRTLPDHAEAVRDELRRNAVMHLAIPMLLAAARAEGAAKAGPWPLALDPLIAEFAKSPFMIQTTSPEGYAVQFQWPRTQPDGLERMTALHGAFTSIALWLNPR